MKKILLLTTFTFVTILTFAQKYELNSPNEKLKSEIEIKDGISVNLIKAGNSAISIQNISMETGNEKELFSDFKVQKATRIPVNETVTPEVKEKATVLTNSCNELEIKFKTGNSITFRMFDEGLAYRFSTAFKRQPYY
jgi:alpha-glucosidase